MKGSQNPTLKHPNLYPPTHNLEGVQLQDNLISSYNYREAYRDPTTTRDHTRHPTRDPARDPTRDPTRSLGRKKSWEPRSPLAPLNKKVSIDAYEAPQDPPAQIQKERTTDTTQENPQNESWVGAKNYRRAPKNYRRKKIKLSFSPARG